MGVVLGALLAISYSNLRGKLAAGLFVVLLYIMLPRLLGTERESGFWTGYGRWLFREEGWQEEHVSSYGALQCYLVVIGCYLLQIVTERVVYIKEILALCMVIGLCVLMVRQEPMGQIAVSFMLTYILLCFIEWTRRRWPKKKRDNHKEFILRIAPFCAIYLILMCFMPAPEKAYDWQIVKDVYYRLQEKLTIWIEDMQRGDREDFGTAQVGFSEDGRLMNSIGDNNELLMTLQGSSGLITNVYLMGKVYDEFDGRKWEQTITDLSHERMMDTLETLYAVYRYDREYTEDYIYSTGLSVRYEHFNTGYIFAPLKTRYLEGCEYSQSGSNLMFGEQKGYGTEYRIVYWQLNIDHPEFYEMTKANLPMDQELWHEVVKIYGGEEVSKVTEEDLELYRNANAEKYGKEVKLSAEVKDYLGSITEGKDSDIEKLRAIEKELSGYTYATKLKKLPGEVDSAEEFLDYFLLESKEGYCAYFATAFVMLARAEGIPARYVEGFCVPVTANKQMNVTAQMTHAWPEVYIEGVGWIPFEPTPGYGQIRYTPWILKSEQESTKGEPERYIEATEEAEEETAFEDVSDEIAKEDTDKRRHVIDVIVIMFAVVIIGAFILFVGERVIFLIKYKRMSSEEKFKTLIECMEMLLSCLGYTREEEETIEEFQNKIAAGMEGMMLYTFTTYEEYQYGGALITKDMVELVNRENRQLAEILKQKRRLYYYYICFRYGILKGETTNG